jgi:hypothetical protein
MTRPASNVVRLRKRAARRQKDKSQWERYPLPFFNLKKRSLWNVAPTGNYDTDCKTGSAYAMKFLESCDGSSCWAHLLLQIVSDMIRAGPVDKDATDAGYPGGIVVGFMLTIGFELAARCPAQKAVRS